MGSNVKRRQPLRSANVFGRKAFDLIFDCAL
jgi:hypothetical protein